MFRRLLFAIAIVFAVIAVFGSITGCDKSNLPTAPTPTVCEDAKATNYGGLLPCTYPPTPLPSPVCTDQKATNYMGLLPCKYPPEGEVHLGYRTGFRDFKPDGGYVPVDMPVMGYSGNVEARVVLDTPGTHRIRMELVSAKGTIIDSVITEVTSSGTIRLPFDGLSAITPRIQNANINGRTISGRVDYYFVADR